LPDNPCRDDSSDQIEATPTPGSLVLESGTTLLADIPIIPISISSKEDTRLDAGTGIENAVSVETETDTETISCSSATDHGTNCNCVDLSNAISTSTSNSLILETEIQASALRETLAENENNRLDMPEELRVIEEKSLALEEEKKAWYASLEWVKGILAETVLRLDSTGKKMKKRTALGVQVSLYTSKSRYSSRH
jgi:hypothetical protein